MRIIQTSYPRVKKIYTYDITQEELDKLKFTWEEFQDALVEDDHERHMEAYDAWTEFYTCLLYTSPSPRDRTRSRMPSSA